MRKLIANDNERAIKWAVGLYGSDDFNFRPEDVGTTIIDDERGSIRAAVFFNQYYGGSIDVHVASAGRNWLRRKLLHATFFYPFRQLGVSRLGTRVRADNIPSLNLAIHLGFRPEGRARCATKDGIDVIILGMLQGECQWLPQAPPVIHSFEARPH